MLCCLGSFLIVEIVGVYVSLSRKGWDGNVPLVSDRLHCRLNDHA